MSFLILAFARLCLLSLLSMLLLGASVDHIGGKFPSAVCLILLFIFQPLVGPTGLNLIIAKCSCFMSYSRPDNCDAVRSL